MIFSSGRIDKRTDSLFRGDLEMRNLILFFILILKTIPAGFLSCCFWSQGAVLEKVSAGFFFFVGRGRGGLDSTGDNLKVDGEVTWFKPFSKSWPLIDPYHAHHLRLVSIILRARFIDEKG